MLKGIDPLLTSDLLRVLAEMGHGDELVICDANFPAKSVAEKTVSKTLINLPNADSVVAARAVLSVFPLDTFVETPALRMEIVGAPDALPEVQIEMQAAIDEAEGKSCPMGQLERHAFYARSKDAYAVIATGERRFYGCFIFTKGVIAPETR